MASSDSDRDGQDPAASQTGSGSSPPMEGNQGDKGPEPSAKYISPDQAWAKCAQDAWSDETGRVKKWDDEIDNLLVFAGLFSAILTAFVVQYYPTLQTNTNTQPQIVVITASHQTNVTSTYSTPDSDTAPDAFTVAINALWFLALVFSIASASLAISVKQWLAHYVPSDSDIGDTRLRLHIWHLRSRGLARWHVPEIVGILPLLLQIAATFFLTGVVLFLWKLNKAIAYLIIIPVSILLLFTAGSTLVPLVELDCPYKSPVSWWLCTIVSHIFDHSNAQPDADTDGTRSAPGDDALPGAYETDSLPRPRRSSHGTGIPSRILPSLYKCADTCRKALRPLRRLPDAWMAAIQARSCRAQSWADREQQIWRANTTGDLVLKEGIMTAHGEQAIFDNFLQNRPNMVRVRTGPRINGSASPSLAVFEFLADSASEDSLHAIAGVAASVLKTTLTAREHSYPEHDTASIPSDPNQRDANAKLDAKISEMMSIIYWCTRTISTSTDAATQATMIPFREWLDVLPVRTFEHDKMVWDVLFAELSRYLEAQVDPHTEAYRDSMVSAIIETLLGVFVNFFNGCWTPWVLDLEDRFLGLCDKALCPHQTHIMARIIKERPEVGFGLEVASRLSAQGMLVPMETVTLVVRVSLELLHQLRGGKTVLDTWHQLLPQCAVNWIGGCIRHARDTGKLDQPQVVADIISPCIQELHAHNNASDDWSVLDIRMQLAMVAATAMHDLRSHPTPSAVSLQDFQSACALAQSALDLAKLRFDPHNNVLPPHVTKLQHFKECLGPESHMFARTDEPSSTNGSRGAEGSA